ncbi:phosphoenolpyruvate-utilizing N-terminal domain-containing protein [Yoonia sp.]|uniref:phosphoenolpyruvate-utilizing N-terminal domain-containing protein n=1 Tax=Yoonia sp. TaxID=2212373 RepID=UPI00358E05CB
MKELKGISTSPGIVIGKVFYYLDENITVPEYHINDNDVDGEIERYENALEMAEREIVELKDSTAGNLEEGRFLDAHILMLKDPEFNSQVKSRIRESKQNAESMLYSTALEYIQRFKELKDPYLRERTVDFYDVSRRVLNHLLYRARQDRRSGVL